MKPGTFVRLPDGREATVVYHGLDGYGIRWGRVEVDVARLLGASGVFSPKPNDWPDELLPEAMLRKPWRTADLPCVGEDYEVIDDTTRKRGREEEGDLGSR